MPGDCASKALPDNIPHGYWNAAGALYGYLFIELSKQGVDVIGESQLVGYPSQYPSVSMIDYNNGKPNARYWVLHLLKDNFHPGDKLVANLFSAPGLATQAFVTPQGRKVLLVNKTNTEKTVPLSPELQSATTLTVDADTGDNEPRAGKVEGHEIEVGAVRSSGLATSLAEYLDNVIISSRLGPTNCELFCIRARLQLGRTASRIRRALASAESSWSGDCKFSRRLSSPCITDFCLSSHFFRQPV